jgi:hypothetical protein
MINLRGICRAGIAIGGSGQCGQLSHYGSLGAGNLSKYKNYRKDRDSNIKILPHEAKGESLEYGIIYEILRSTKNLNSSSRSIKKTQATKA